MKKKLITVGLLALSAAAGAQERHLPGLEKSVFRNVAPTAAASDPKALLRAQTKVQASFPGWNARIDAVRGSFTDAYGPAVSIPGASVAERVDYLVAHQLRSFGVDRSDWETTRNLAVNKAVYADFRQSFGGREVVFSRMSFRFTADGKQLVRVQLNAYPKPAPGLVPAISAEEAAQAASRDLVNAYVDHSSASAAWVWFPVPDNNGYALHPAYAYTIEGQDKERNLPLLLTGYVDALTGEVLYRNNEVKETVDGFVKGSVHATTLTSPSTLQPLPNLTMTLGTNTADTTDAVGYFTNSAFNPPTNVTFRLQGKWSKVNTGNQTPSFTTTITAPGQTFTFGSAATTQQINAYYHVNRVHDFMKFYLPAFTGMDVVLPTNVDLTTGTCNAFYNGSSINFYAAAGGCNSFALIGDVVYHEYGHGITGRFYSSMGTTIYSGALNEANSDIWALSITRSPVLGDSAFVGGGNIRRYDQTPKVFPKDIIGEVHADGEIVAGAWWDVGVNIGSIDTMTKLFAATYFDLPNGPAGTEGDIYHQVLVSALMDDDIDNNLNNGTPHFVAIVDAFAKHGIYLLGDAIFNHNELAHQPVATPITVNGTLVMTSPGIFQDMKLFYRVRGTGTGYDSVAMTDQGGMAFTAEIPGQQPGAILDYYFRVTDRYAASDRIYFPTGFDPAGGNQSTIPFQFGVGLLSVSVTDFEAPATGWQIADVTGDNATGGKWLQAVPVMSRVTQGTPTPLVVQTGADHTSGAGKCLITGNASSVTSSVDQADVDGGATTVLTPAFNISTFKQPVIEYYRWFSNDRGLNARSDPWRTQVCDAYDNAWVNVENTYQADYNWRRRIFSLRELVPGVTDSFRMRFIATDAVNNGLTNSGQNTVEAGLDDFVIYDRVSGQGVENSGVKLAGIFPNPADDRISILLGESVSEGSIGLYDVSGRQLSIQAISAGQLQYSINVATVPTGTYFVMVQTGKAVQSHKISVRH